MGMFGKRKTSPVGAADRVDTEPARSNGHGAPTAVTGLTDLHTIAARGTAVEVQECIAAGADVNEPNRVGYTPLSIAASRGDVDVARALLEQGADVDRTDPNGTTALAAAVLNSKGNGEMISLLLEHGANPRKPNNRGQSPLELARRMTSYDVVRFFEHA